MGAFLLATQIPSLELTRDSLSSALIAGIRAFAFAALALGIFSWRPEVSRLGLFKILALLLAFLHCFLGIFSSYPG